MYFQTIQQMKKQLGLVENWFDSATAFADSKKFDPNVFVGFRLAPDMFPFSRQVQIVCDTLKLGVSRLTGKAAPAHADTETTLAELRTRIASVRAYVDSVSDGDFAEAASRVITQPRWEGKTMTGHDYFLEHMLPNFYFHLSQIYALFRHNGVPLGKKDFLGPLTQKAPA